MALPPPLPQPPPGRDDDTDAYCASVSVYPLIHEIRVDVAGHIDTPLTYEQLVAPDSTYTIIRPLTEKYLALGNPAVVFCLLLNKVQFVSDSSQVSIATLSSSRATLCEILAIRVLRGWSDHSLPLATVLLTPWPLFQGAPEEVLAGAKEEGEEDALDDHGTALEMAIISQSKVFIRSPSCQKVIEGIWSGKIIYTSLNAHAFIQDTYKKRPIQIYNPHRAPFLDHYRLKVPKYRAILEYANFVILFVLYCFAIERGKRDYINAPEAIFIVYALAFSLDKLATIREHGLKVFASSMVNGFDLIFVFIFATYLAARILGTLWHNANYMEVGTDLMAVGAVLMFPRLVFMSLANNLMVLSIRSMLTEFFFLMSVGIFCFLGFIYALRTLTETIQVSTICWWLLEIYFGLDATGFETSYQFHPYLGPILMVIYAFLSNTLLTVVCVAVLGNTFAAINADASAESMFRKAVSTIEGVKADMVFSYQLPFNLIALALLYPLKYWLSDRWFHKVNVFMIRLTNLPVLVVIAFYERQKYSQSSWWEQLCDFTDHYVGRLSTATEGIVGARIDISAVFDLEREYGHFYEGLDDDVFDEDEDDETECDGDEEESISLDAGLLPGNGPGVISLSPDQETFPTPQQSPNVPRFQRRPSVGGGSGNGSGSGTGAPLQRTMSGVSGPRQRVRRNSILFNGPASLFNGPSPLARIYTRGDDGPAAHLGPIRRSTLNVGSLPVTHSLSGVSGSPRRTLRVSGSSGGSSAFSSSVSASPPISKSQRPSVTPIDERSPSVPSPAGPAAGASGESGDTPGGKVQFPRRPEDAPARVTFDKLPSPGQRRTSWTTTTPLVTPTPKKTMTPEAPAPEAIAPDDTAPPPGADPATPPPPPRPRTVSAESRVDEQQGTPRSSERTALPKPTATAATKATSSTTSPHVAPGKDDTKADKSKALIRAAEGVAAAAKRPGVAPNKQSANSSPSLRNVSGGTTGSRAPPSPSTNLKVPLPGPVDRTASPMLKPRGGGDGAATPAGKPKTASELLESMESHNAHAEQRMDVRTVESQLAAVEARQQRIEEMIMRLLECSQSQRGVDIRRCRGNDEHDTFDDSI